MKGEQEYTCFNYFAPLLLTYDSGIATCETGLLMLFAMSRLSQLKACLVVFNGFMQGIGS